jgi:hypothetical protein
VFDEAAEAETPAPPPAAVIPFPDPNHRRKGVAEDPRDIPPVVRHPSLLEKLGVAFSGRRQARRASGWR